MRDTVTVPPEIVQVAEKLWGYPDKDTILAELRSGDRRRIEALTKYLAGARSRIRPPEHRSGSRAAAFTPEHQLIKQLQALENMIKVFLLKNSPR